MFVREATVTYKTTRRPECDRPIKSSEEVAKLAEPWVQGQMKEHFYVVLLDAKHKYLCHELVSLGTLDSTHVHPRECFTLAVREQAAAVVFIHNHPSGDPSPSPEDRAVTRRLVQSGEILGIDVLDHIILADGGLYSFRDAGEIS